MRLREVPGMAFEGGMNVNVVVTDDAGRSYLKRYPKSAEQVSKLLKHEHDALGFTNRGGSFRRRSADEQGSFLQRAAGRGLKVLPPAYIDEKGFTYYRFIEGAQTLEHFLPHASPDEMGHIVHEFFADLRLAHANGIIYGDRWAPNILVVPRVSPLKNNENIHGTIRRAQSTILHIDFDIELSGPVAREFELAEATFYTLRAGGGRIVLILANILGIDVNVPGFDFKAFVDFLEKFAKLFKKDPKYGSSEKEVVALIAALRTTKGVGQ